jgi:transcriptional regulator with XRE-family HTH domain
MWDKRRLLGAKLAEARKQRGWTLREAERELGKSRTWLSNCETGERVIPALELWVICQAYQINFAALIEDVMSHPNRAGSEAPV